jgi:hypothetical protein
MTEEQRLFLVQARTDFDVFSVFRDQKTTPQCHALHYLQMATELLGKAYAWGKGPTKLTHRAFVKFLKKLESNTQAQKQLGYEGKNAKWKQLIRKSKPLAEQIEDLAPALAGNGPNPEYPWPPDAPINTPVEFEFAVWIELTDTAYGRQFLTLMSRLFAVAEAYI